MALTVPALPFPDPNAQIVVTVDYTSTGISIPLTPDEIAEWTDADLNAKMLALKAAFAALLPPNMPGVSVYTVWTNSASVQVNPTT